MPNPFNDREFTNFRFSDIVENCLIDVWQRTEDQLADYEDEIYSEEPSIFNMPQGMFVQYIPNGIIILFGQQGDFNGEWQQ